MQKLLVILGPTSTGKTDLALSLARKFNGELIACDSRQVYTGLDVGTGKMPGQKAVVKKGKWFWEINGVSKAPASAVKVWMYDVTSLKRQYTVYDYVVDSNKVINDVQARNKLPIVVGGTGLYLKALLEGLPNLGIPIDLNLRKKLNMMSLDALQKKLQEFSFEKWKNMNDSDNKNPRRLIRAIELAVTKTKQTRFKKNNFGLKNFNLLKIGLTAPREALYQRINKQVIRWINGGIIEEVKKLISKNISKKRITSLGLEYAVLIEYLNNNKSEEMIIKMQNKVRSYARRQITWFRKENNIVWFGITDRNFSDEVENKVAKWYYQATDDSEN